MSRDMLGVAVRKLVTLPGPVLGTVCDLLEKLSDPEWVEALKKFLRKENPWAEVKKAASDLLKAVTTITVAAIETFSAEDHFRVGETDGVKIGYVGDNLARIVRGKVETNVPEATLRVHQLQRASLDGPIIAELDGEEVAETTFAQMWQMMKAQGHGQKGKLLVNGYANIFYIRDASGVFWAVHCYWDASYGYWCVYARPFTDPFRWFDGSQVVSR